MRISPNTPPTSRIRGLRTAWPGHPGLISIPNWTPPPRSRRCSTSAHTAAYSGFEGHVDHTSLADWLRTRGGVDQVDIAGIATDYCVRQSAADATRAGFKKTRVLVDLTAGVAPGSTADALDEMRGRGIELVHTA